MAAAGMVGWPCHYDWLKPTCDVLQGKSDYLVALQPGSIWQLITLWLVGAVMGFLLPRPQSGAWGKPGWLQSVTILNTQWRRALLAWHGVIIVREVWYHFTCPGTFRRLWMALLGWLMGKGWHFDFPTASQPGTVAGTPCDPKLADKETNSSPEESWYISHKDLDFYKKHAEQCVESAAGPWEVLMQREIAGVVKYVAYRRTLPCGKTEYKTHTLCPDASAVEFMDLYMDDDYRPNWDTMIAHHEVLEHGDFAQRQQVVRWVRRFPFSFISDREYIIAKRFFKEGDSLYGVTKAVEHPRAPVNTDVVRCDVYYSMWRSRTVECPWGSGKPACETILLHHEQMKIPENLARFAVKHGMWGFVRKLSTETSKFVEARRQRCRHDEVDMQAYGSGFKPNPPMPLSAALSPFKPSSGMRRTSTSTSALSSITTQSSMDVGDAGQEQLCRAGSGPLPRSKSGRLRGVAAFALASGVAMLLTRSGSSTMVSRRSTFTSTSGMCSAASGTPTSKNGGGKLRRVHTQHSSVNCADPTFLRRSLTSHAVEDF